MKAKELRVKTITELKTLLSERREALRNMRFKVAQRQLKKVHDLKAAKRDIARILTIIKQKSYEK
ncbi:50S ribosomal protein L29 [Candidatus Kuenenbacteria bacterium CG_4_9_14_3_um_filter_39_14]|uniref:Large ribosomal subunit protein uL29 n=7 Tax=Candidatus Kueneniibacteriota TaxID=1752740 RepID=A0A2M7IMN8_9BACT|nr:50S ribosomal protein L29 [Candidatus Kuenenbacteria bacterium]OIP56766.1 MAG: 50S ribosomal protein L29 [Candidatus Kuenenbacteria bacterium CG2_30_39_24]PIP28938.1 MAG: 50S ribosomal protein L29 [Candidatus Kuenenbacteria bacterium CG23_combo_of_CG06-09_8_20_14_all_39_39]PIP75300.1 MAG: 50S ribosomal protein L29 [Candidatus Kuenenbacteria bacterium CG22_combo_CG10-13_8_21_14_all_39_9]PIR81086.1 MAG: 50S ribosomal protein L29 [Candidatus Kuenenbacteria bacterium CG10_big_fil_rev_8_21_14_0_1